MSPGTLEFFQKNRAVFKDSYEIVQTVGFESNSKTEGGEIKPFRFRIEVVRRLVSQQFQVIVWSSQTDPDDLSSFVWYSVSLDASHSNSEAALEAAMTYLEKKIREQGAS